jgi:hypothetical protein
MASLFGTGGTAAAVGRLGGLATVLTVSVITLLVWLVAEGQTLRQQRMSLQIGFPNEGEVEGARVVRVLPGQAWVGNAEVVAEGATSSLQRLADLLRGRVALSIGQQLPGEPGEHEVDLRTALRNTDAFRRAGVNVESVQPERVSVEIDTLEVLSIPVRVDVGRAELDGSPSVSPASILVSMPSSVATVLRNSGGAVEAVARVTQDQMRALVPGRTERVVGVAVELPGALRERWLVRADRTSVDVDLRLRSRASTLTIPRLPVRLLLAPSELGRWRITIPPTDQDLIDVTLTGPEEALDRIRRREVTPTAVVELGFEELERGIRSKQASIFGLPPGVTASVPRGEVGFSVERVVAPGPGTDPGLESEPPPESSLDPSGSGSAG